jgi:hypothetical protein
VTRTVTYRNHGDAPVTLDLTVAGDAALFAVSPARLTVPAGGTAEATVTADTRADRSQAAGSLTAAVILSAPPASA